MQPDRRHQRRRTRLLFAAIAALTTLSCDSGNPVDPRAAVVGSFQLSTVNSHALPTLSADGGRTFESGGIQFKEDGTFSEIIYYRTTDPQHPISGFAGRGGSWTISGDQISTTMSVGGGVRTGTFANNTVTFGPSAVEADVYVFAR